MIIKPAKRLRGVLNLPGDKSISHRAALIGALAEGKTRIENFATSADCASTLNCLKQLGISIKQEGTTVLIEGVGLNGLREPKEKLDCGNSGSTMRMLAGVLAGQNFSSCMIGDESLSKRPMKRIIVPLEMMGAKIEATDGHAPLRVFGKKPLQPISYETPVASAQVKSCVLLAGFHAKGKTSVIENVTTRDHTERMLRWFGVDVEKAANKISIEGLQQFQARDVSVPSDISSAAFFLVAASCLHESNLELKNIGFNSTRSAIIRTMIDLGANISIINEHEQSNEPIADVQVRSAECGVRSFDNKDRRPNVLSGSLIAQLIDELPVLAVFGSQLEGGLTIRDAAELRVKESDRIATVVENLRAMGAGVEEYKDGLRVEKSKLRGARVSSHGDHRIAMAFAVAALSAEGETEIIGADCVNVSFPNFFELLESVCER
jgi:3-phosphoshikimate 1-carboxyvinyltransferase